MYLFYLVLQACTSKKRRVDSASATAQSMVADVTAQSDSAAFIWLRTAGWAVAPFALPVGAAAIVAGYLANATQRGINARRQPMPEHWYAQVIEESTEEGKLFLGKILSRKGFVTVAQAAQWMEIESRQRPNIESDAKQQLCNLHMAQPGLLQRMRKKLTPF